MENYLIEFRFQSKKIRSYLKRMIYGINRKFGVGKRKHVPHITLVGPLKTSQERRLITDFSRICSETELMRFKGNGFGTFEPNRVVYVNIGANEKLNNFRIKLVESLREYCTLKSHDKRKEMDKFGYHSTLAMNLDQREFDRIKNYVNQKHPPKFSQIIMRVTLLKRGKILKEYDFIQRRLLNRRQALNKGILRKSKTLLKEFMKGNYHLNTMAKSNIQNRIENKKSIFSRIISFFKRN